MAARDFHRFPDLPTELRLLIWSHCIPGPRVVEMDFPMSNQHLIIPSGFLRGLWSSPAGRVALVSRVCREARSVALNRVQYVTWIKNEDQKDENGMVYLDGYRNDWGVDVPVRFRQGIDIVHLNWHYGYERLDMETDPQYPWETFKWLVNQAAAASVSADLLLPFDPERHNPFATSFRPEDMRHFSPHHLYYVVLAIVEIHISAKEAAQARVFGVLGEQPVRLVDPRDTTTIVKFRDVWRRYQSGLFQENELDVAEFFTTAVDDAEVYYIRVEQWRQNLEKAWLWYQGHNLDISLDTQDEFWPNRHAEHARQDNLTPGWILNWNHQELIREHPWVQAQLELMPRFEPAIMFRHCVNSSGSCQRSAMTFPDWLIADVAGESPPS
jgi:hypothetical protein